MAEPLTLNAEEQLLYDKLAQLVADTENFYSSGSRNYNEQEDRYKQMAQIAHDLHMALKKDGHEPKHHAYMYKNRGVPVEDVEFYNHIHPVQDLLSFILDPDSNNDPEDTTMNVKFRVRIFTNRWGHYDGYNFTRIESGWKIDGASTFKQNQADKTGEPALFSALKHDSVSYPVQTAELLECIWEKAKRGATQEQVQKYLNDLAEWISICEKATPSVLYEG
jgi:hypothetical protein